MGTAKILVVEDSPIPQLAIKLMLTSLGYEFDIAPDGKQALSMFNENYDAIILDIGLPDISGLEVSKRIRAKEGSKHTPIIGWTSHDNMKKECLAAGYDEVIIKSSDDGKFKELLRNYVHQ